MVEARADAARNPEPDPETNVQALNAKNAMSVTNAAYAVAVKRQIPAPVSAPVLNVRTAETAA